MMDLRGSVAGAANDMILDAASVSAILLLAEERLREPISERRSATLLRQPPYRETVLRCGKCEKPFCTKCVVQTPVGLRCRECANLKRLPVYDVPASRLAFATLAGVGSGVLGGVVFFALVGSFSLWLSPLFGYAVGEIVSVAANRKRGPNLQLIVFVSIVLGAILGKYGPFLLSAWLGSGALGLVWGNVAQALGRDIWLMLFTAVALIIGIGRVR